MAKIFTGSGVAIVTPFTDEGVNLPVYRQLIDWQIESGTDAIVSCGTTGEPSTMTTAEKEATIACAVETAKGRVPVVAGTGGNNTAASIEASKRAQELGADALLVVTPYYNKTSPQGLIKHFMMIADAVTIPIILYNVPSRTGMNITPGQLAALAEHENIAAIKEASANIEQITEMTRLCGDKIDFYSGNDDHVLPLMALGFSGVISVLANVMPKETHELVQSFLDGNIEEARRIQFRVNPLVQALFCETNPIPAKTALRLMGYDAGPLRMPLCDMAPANLELLRTRMRDLGLCQ